MIHPNGGRFQLTCFSCLFLTNCCQYLVAFPMSLLDQRGQGFRSFMEVAYTAVRCSEGSALKFKVCITSSLLLIRTLLESPSCSSVAHSKIEYIFINFSPICTAILNQRRLKSKVILQLPPTAAQRSETWHKGA